MNNHLQKALDAMSATVPKADLAPEIVQAKRIAIRRIIAAAALFLLVCLPAWLIAAKPLPSSVPLIGGLPHQVGACIGLLGMFSSVAIFLSGNQWAPYGPATRLDVKILIEQSVNHPAIAAIAKEWFDSGHPIRMEQRDAWQDALDATVLDRMINAADGQYAINAGAAS